MPVAGARALAHTSERPRASARDLAHADPSGCPWPAPSTWRMPTRADARGLTHTSERPDLAAAAGALDVAHTAGFPFLPHRVYPP